MASDAAQNNIFRLYKEKLNMLLDVAQTINEDHSVEDLLLEFETLLKEELGIGRILLFLHEDETWKATLTCGVDKACAEQIDVARDLLSYTKTTDLSMTDNENLNVFDYAIPLYHKYKIIAYVLIGESDMTEGVSTTIKNLKYIQILSNIIIVFIENKKMQETLLHQEYLRRELELAKSMQKALVPSDKDLRKTTTAVVRSLYHPHHDVGGDYYDVIPLSPYHIGFCMADVSGKGIGAALLMSNFQALVRGMFTSSISMKKLIRRLNDRVCQNTSSGKFITAFIARYNVLTGVMTYVNAGHLPPIVYSEKSGRVVELEQGCIGLGMLDTIPGIEVGKIIVHRGTRLVAFTDGLVEVDEGNLVQSSTEKIKTIMSTTPNIISAMNKISQMAEQNRQDGLTFDDVSVLGIQFLKNGLLSL